MYIYICIYICICIHIFKHHSDRCIFGNTAIIWRCRIPADLHLDPYLKPYSVPCSRSGWPQNHPVLLTARWVAMTSSPLGSGLVGARQLPFYHSAIAERSVGRMAVES